MASPLEAWQRGPRTSFQLSKAPGVYALFVRNRTQLPAITPGPDGLIYIGLAANRNGLLGRCHFAGKTRNHSPRKSLAALLMDELKLVPILITKPNSSNTWGLDTPSEARLTAWMHANVDLAIEFCAAPAERETELIARYSPPLNLKNCPQTTQHRLVSDTRAAIMASLGGPASPRLHPLASHQRSYAPGAIGAQLDTANAIAARFSLDPKSYRQRLRETISWYRKPQDWTFPVGSQEWQDITAVAKRMAG